MVSLLRELGIEATPLLLSAQSPQLPARTLPSPISFDHVIVQVVVDGQSYYVDPTRNGQNVPIQTLARAFPGAATLPVDANAKELLTLPSHTDAWPLYEHVENIAITDFDGDATLETREIYRGSYAEWARQRFPSLTIAEFKKAMLGLYEKQYPGVTLLAPPSYQDHPAENRFELLIRYNLPKPVTHTEKRYAFEYDSQIIYNTLGIPDNIVRNFPLQLPVNNYRGRYRLKLTWPKSVRENFAPKAKTLDNPYFKAHEEYTIRGNHVDYLMDYQVKVKEVNAKEVPILQKEAKRLVEFTTGKFHMLEANVRGEESALFNYREFESFGLVTDAFSTVNAFKGKTESEISKEDACELLLSAPKIASFVGKNSNFILADLEKFLTEKTAQTEAKLCLARVLFFKGEYARSVPNYQAEKPLADDSPYTKDLAWARFYSGDKDGAISDMTRFRTGQDKQESTVNYGLDLASEIALWQRIGKPLSKKMLDYAMAIPDGPWPRPLLAMQVGLITETDLITGLDTLPKDTRDIALTEAWFYIGQKYLAENRQAAAKEAFDRLRVLGLRSSELTPQAFAEMNRLENEDENYWAGMRAYHSHNYAEAIAKWRLSAAAGSMKARYGLGELHYYGNGVKKDFHQAMYWLEPAARQGDADAQAFIGALYRDGEGTPVNANIGLSWYQKGAEQGHKYAQNNLGHIYLDGEIVEKDLAKAFSYLLLAANQGLDLAQATVANLYAQGKGIEQDYKQALRWSMLASVQENQNGKMQLGALYSEGTGVKRNGKAALHWFMQAADQGNIQALFNIGAIYGRGIDVPQDYKTAAVWYEKARAKGHIEAIATLGWMHLYGHGVDLDYAKAFELLDLAAKYDSETAKTHLAHMYRNGLGVQKDDVRSTVRELLAAEYHENLPQREIDRLSKLDAVVDRNFIEALALFQEAAEQGNKFAQFKLGQVYQYSRRVEKDLNVSLKWYQKAADQGLPVAINNLGDMFENGFAVTQDYSQAIKLYEKSAILGSSWGFFSLGTLYETGKGKPKDAFMAYTFYQIATKIDRSHKDHRKQVEGNLTTDERKKADEIADSWKAGSPLPTRQ